MSVFAIVLGQMITLLLMTAAGWGLGKVRLVTETRQLSSLLSRVCLPAMILSMLQVPYSRELLANIGLTALSQLLIILVGMAAGFAAAVLLRRARSAAWAWALIVGYSNVIFMGRPVMTALYGEAVEPLIAGVTLMFNVLTFSLGALAAIRSSPDGAGRISARKIFLNPVVVVSLLSFVLFLAPFRLPGPVAAALSSLGAMTTPLSMVMLGVDLSKVDLGKALLRLDIWAVSVCRLVLVPVASWALLRLLVSDPVILGMLTVAAAMPVASTVTVVLTENNGDTGFSTTATTLTNLLCALTAPVTLSLLLG